MTLAACERKLRRRRRGAVRGAAHAGQAGSVGWPGRLPKKATINCQPGEERPVIGPIGHGEFNRAGEFAEDRPDPQNRKA